MCLITFGKMPTEETLKRAEENNPHGTGVAWLTKRGVEYRKNVTVPYLLSLPDSVKASCAVHFRIATVGGMNPRLTHPFPVSHQVGLADKGVAPAVIFHNGHVMDWEKNRKAVRGANLKGPMSDSRLMARLVHDYGYTILNMFTDYQRILYVSRERSVLFGAGWIEDKNAGTWYSNDSYKTKHVTIWSRGKEYDPSEWNEAGWAKACEAMDRRSEKRNALAASLESDLERSIKEWDESDKSRFALVAKSVADEESN